MRFELQEPVPPPVPTPEKQGWKPVMICAVPVEVDVKRSAPVSKE